MSSSAAPAPDASVTALDARLTARVTGIAGEELGARAEELARIAPEAAALVEDLQGYLAGGKLLRPRFCFWGGVAALGREPSEAELEALARHGAAIELVQAAALLHDDVIDHSPVRRGRPAMHVQWALHHRAQELAGEAEEFGVSIAIVLGDLALSWAEQVAGAVDGEPAAVRRARAEFDALRTEVMSGQFLDILHQAGGYRSAPGAEAAALSVIRWKTVPYTVLRPVRTGAALAGADDAALAALADWAVEVGTAFQLRDDLLSVVGEQSTTGKPIGGDILEGKRTVLLARTEAAADPAGRELLGRVVGRAGASPEEIAAVHRLMVDTGAVASVIEEVRRRAARGQELLGAADGLGALGREGLDTLAALATDVDSLPA